MSVSDIILAAGKIIKPIIYTASSYTNSSNGSYEAVEAVCGMDGYIGFAGSIVNDKITQTPTMIIFGKINNDTGTISSPSAGWYNSIWTSTVYQLLSDVAGTALIILLRDPYSKLVLIKYDAASSEVAKIDIGAGSGGYMKADKSNNIFVCVDTSLSFIKLNPAANSILLQIAVSGATSPSSHDIAIDATGNIYLSGKVTVSSVNYGVLLKFSPTGSILWQKIFTSTANTNTKLVVSLNCVYLTNDGVLFKLDTSGNIMWQKSTPSNPSNPAIDNYDNVYISSYASSAGSNILKIGTEGNVIWQRILGPAWVNIKCMTVDAFSDSLLVGGTAGGGQNNGFVIRLPLDGSKTGFNTPTDGLTCGISNITPGTPTYTNSNTSFTASSSTTITITNNTTFMFLSYIPYLSSTSAAVI
jgi:hypothetical protein